MFTLLLSCLLTPALGDRDWRTRERAHRALAALGPHARPALESAAASARASPEVRARAAALLLPWEGERVAAVARRLTGPQPPWMWECGSWGDLWSRYLGEARRAVGEKGGPCWPEYRHATLLWVQGRVWARTPAGEIAQALREMREEERGWWERNPERVGPPAGDVERRAAP